MGTDSFTFIHPFSIGSMYLVAKCNVSSFLFFHPSFPTVCYFLITFIQTPPSHHSNSSILTYLRPVLSRSPLNCCYILCNTQHFVFYQVYISLARKAVPTIVVNKVNTATVT